MTSADASIERRLLNLVNATTDAGGRAWLESARDTVRRSRAGEGDVVEALLMVSPAARRKLGRRALSASEEFLETADGPMQLADWEVGDAGRALLIFDALADDEDVVTPVYRAGDEAERMSVTRCLSLLPCGDALKPLALETGRANSAALFSSLALGNPYPAARYTEHEFNQLVLKALFIGLRLARIVGLAQRVNAELTRMCEDYVGERTAAGRSVPADIQLAMTGKPGEGTR